MNDSYYYHVNPVVGLPEILVSSDREYTEDYPYVLKFGDEDDDEGSVAIKLSARHFNALQSAFIDHGLRAA